MSPQEQAGEERLLWPGVSPAELWDPPLLQWAAQLAQSEQQTVSSADQVSLAEDCALPAPGVIGWPMLASEMWGVGD